MDDSIELIGTYLVKENIVSRSQLSHALAEQEKIKKQGTRILIGEMCIRLGFCTPQDVAHALRCKNQLNLVRKPTTLPAMQAFRESIKKARAATKEHLNGRLQTHS